MCFEGSEELVKGGEGPRITRAGADLFAGGRVPARVQGQLHRLGDVQVDIHRAGPVVALQSVLQAADRGVVPQCLLRQPLPAQALDGVLVEVEQEGAALGFRDHVHHPAEELAGGLGVQPDVGLGLQEVHLLDDVQHQVGQFVAGILPILVHPAEGDELAERGVDALVGTDPALVVVGVVVFDPQTLEPLLGLPGGQATALDVGLVVGVEVLVNTARGDAGAGVTLGDQHQHVGEPKGLEGLGEGLGGLPGDLAADAGAFFQFSGTETLGVF